MKVKEKKNNWRKELMLDHATSIRMHMKVLDWFGFIQKLLWKSIDVYFHHLNHFEMVCYFPTHRMLAQGAFT